MTKRKKPNLTLDQIRTERHTLVDMGYVRDSGRREWKNGREEIVWEITPEFSHAISTNSTQHCCWRSPTH
jgi:hypothetical protein